MLQTESVLIEVPCASLADCLAAELGGAQRLELCSALELGGLTPSLGLLASVKSECNLPVMGMVRPRTGGFRYSEDEMVSMERDIDLMREHRADGFVFGVLDDRRQVDAQACTRLLRHIPPSSEKVFHRAFDIVEEPFEALEQLIDLGFARVLTSGQKPTALEGSDLIRQLIERAEGRIEVLPGGGIRDENAKVVVEATGADQLHLSCFVEREDLSMRGAALAFNGRPALEAGYRIVSEQVVGSIVALFGDE